MIITIFAFRFVIGYLNSGQRDVPRGQPFATMAHEFRLKAGLLLTYLTINMVTADFDYEYDQQNVTERGSYLITSEKILELVRIRAETGTCSNCVWTWKFCAQEGMQLNVSFTSFSMTKLYTFFEFGDGLIPDNVAYGVSHTRMAMFRYTAKPDDIISLSNKLWIRFKRFNGKQFAFAMTVTSFYTRAETAILVNRTFPMSITFPGNPSANYKNNAYRLWTVRAPEPMVISVVVDDFDLENPSELADVVYIGDTTARFLNHAIAGQPSYWARWRGTKPRDDFLGLFRYCSASSSIFVLFTSNYKDTGRGFSLRFFAVTSCSPATGGPITSTDEKTTVSMTTFPSIIITTDVATTKTVNDSRDHEMIPTMIRDNGTMGEPNNEASTMNEVFIWKTSLIAFISFIGLVFGFVAVTCLAHHRRTLIKFKAVGPKLPKPSYGKRIFRRAGATAIDSENDTDDYLQPYADPSPYGPITYVTRIKFANQGSYYYNVQDSFPTCIPAATRP